LYQFNPETLFETYAQKESLIFPTSCWETILSYNVSFYFSA